MNIGVRIKNARINAKLTQEQVADTLCVSRQTISNWETGGSDMVIKPQKSTTFAWFWILSWIPTVKYLEYRELITYSALMYVVAFFIFCLFMLFTKAFSTYYLDYDGITQKCFFVTRHFYWKDFKFIGKKRDIGNGATSIFIRCSTVPLPKNMTAKEFEKKAYWPPSKTITIEWPNKGGEAFYQEFLSYCGGERDIRE